MKSLIAIGKSILLRIKCSPGPSVIINLILSIRWKCWIHPKAKILFPFACSFGNGARLGKCKLICFGKKPYAIKLGKVYVHDGVILDALGGYIEIDNKTTLNPYCVLYGAGGLKIGKNCGIATHTCIVAANHTFDLLDVPIMEQPISMKGIVIEDNVWIGAGCKILDGVTIHSGTVIGAGAVVTQEFPPNSVLGGVPAKLIKMRKQISSEV